MDDNNIAIYFSLFGIFLQMRILSTSMQRRIFVNNLLIEEERHMSRQMAPDGKMKLEQNHNLLILGIHRIGHPHVLLHKKLLELAGKMGRSGLIDKTMKLETVLNERARELVHLLKNRRIRCLREERIHLDFRRDLLDLRRDFLDFRHIPLDFRHIPLDYRHKKEPE